MLLCLMHNLIIALSFTYVHVGSFVSQHSNVAANSRLNVLQGTTSNLYQVKTTACAMTIIF